MPYCPRCGKEVTEDDSFCPYCREPLKQQRVIYRREEQREKNEKGEKDEKHEKGEKGEKGERGEKQEGSLIGALMGGLILVWLGVAFLLRQLGYITGTNFGWFFLMGVGCILFVRGLIAMTQPSGWRGSNGYIIGGLILAIIGFAGYYDWTTWWPYVIIGLGLIIIINAIISRGRNPRP